MRKCLQLGLGLLTIFGAAQQANATLTSNWVKNSVATGPDLWQDNRNRGMAYNAATDHVLVTDTATPSVRIYNASTGAFINSMTLTGVTGAAVSGNKIKVVNLGSGNYSIYLTSLATNTKTGSIILWRWYGAAAASEETLGAPSVIFRNRASNASAAEASPVGPTLSAVGYNHTERTGDAWELTNSGTAVSLYTVRTLTFRNDNVYRFDYTDPGSGAAGAVSAVTNIPLTGVTNFAFGTATAAGITVDGHGGDIIVCTRSNGFSGVFSNSGVFKGTLGGSTFTSGHPAIGTLAGRKLIAYIFDGDPVATAAAPASYTRIAVADATNGTTQGAVIDFSSSTAFPLVTNGNATGDSSFDPANNRLFTLTSNHVLASYTFSAPAAGVTKTWNGSVDTNWFTAANWTPSGVPTINDDVVLDHSINATAYTVSIGTSVVDAQARTISVGDGTGSLIQLSLAATNTLRQAVTLQGSKTGASVTVNDLGQLNYLSTALGGTIWYAMDPGFVYLFKNGGTFNCNTARSFSTPFGADLPAGFARNLYGVARFESTSNLNVAGTDIFNGPGRKYGNVNLNVAGSVSSTLANQPLEVTNLTIGAALAYNVTLASPVIINGTFTNNGTALTYNCLPLTFNSSQNFPTSLTSTGDLLVPSGVTLNFPNSTTIGTATGGRGLRVAGNVTIPTGVTLTVNSYIAPLTGSTVSGAGAIVYGANAGIGTDDAAGIASGATPSQITVAAPGTIPSATAGQFAFFGSTDQSLGAYLSGGTVGGIIVNKPGYAKVSTGSPLQINNVLSMTTGVLEAVNTTVTLGTAVATPGALTFPGGGGLIRGAFKRWLGTAAAANDFPLTDANNRLRIFTLNRTGVATTGGTIEVAYTAGPTGTATLTSTNPLGSTLSGVDSNWTNVDQSGLYTVWTGGGFVAGVQDSDVIMDVDGFKTGQDGSFTGVVQRNGPGGSWNVLGTVAAIATSNLRAINFSQSLINYDLNPLRAVRRNAQGSANVFSTTGVQFGLGGPSTLVPVSVSGFNID